MNLSDTISILLPSEHRLYEPIPGYILSITFDNSLSDSSHGAYKLKKKSLLFPQSHCVNKSKIYPYLLTNANI